MIITTFLRKLWANPTSGYLTLWRLQDHKSFHFPFDADPLTFDSQLSDISQAALSLDERGYDTYYGVGLRQEKLAHHELGQEAQVRAWPGVWIDVDIQHPAAHVSKNLPPDLGAVDKTIDLFSERTGIRPSIVVHSGYGLHVYYLCEEPVVAETENDRRAFKKTLQKVQRQFGAALDEVGRWQLDNTAKLQQVLRLPGLSNRKVPNDVQVVEILVDDGPRYPLDLLDRAVVRGRGRPIRTRSEPPPSPGSTRPGAAGDVPLEEPAPLIEEEAEEDEAEVPAEKKKRGRPPEVEWYHEVRRRARRLTDKTSFKLASLVMAGEPFAEQGSRNQTSNKVAGILCALALRVKPNVEAQEIYDQFMSASIDAMAALDNNPQNPALTEAKVVDQIRRNLIDLREQEENRVAAQKRLAETITKLVARKGRLPGPPGSSSPGGGGQPGGGGGRGSGPFDGAASAAGHPIPKLARGTGTFEPVTMDQLPKEFGAGGVPEFPVLNGPEDIASALRLLIVQYHTHFYVLKDGKYQYPVSKEGVENRLRDDLADEEAVTWEYENEKGDIKRKTLPHFLRDYCTTARHLIFDLTAQESYFDVDTATFVEAVAPIRQLEPEYNEQIHTWLKLLGGDDADKVIDWVSTITRLDAQNCALYLHGRSDSGKTVLAHGLARLWTEHGAPTNLEHALSNFNDDIAKCPLIVADEHLPKGCTSAALRLLVGTSSRACARKFYPNTILRGAIRLLLVANNDRMLQMGDEDQDATDIDAVAGRFLEVHIPDGPAADYLRSIGGKWGDMKGWIDDSQIAKHALWLAQNRREGFIPGKRFLVEGRKSQVHRQMVMQNHVVAVVAEWLVRFLEKPSPAPSANKTIICENGRFYVNTYAVVDNWEQYITSHKTMSTHRVGKALHAMSRPEAPSEVRFFKKRYYDIDVTLLFEWAEKCRISDEETLSLQVEKLSKTLHAVK